MTPEGLLGHSCAIHTPHPHLVCVEMFCQHMYLCFTGVPCVCGSQKGALDSLKLKLQTVGNYHMGTGNNPSTLEEQKTLSPAPQLWVLTGVSQGSALGTGIVTASHICYLYTR